MPFLPFSDKKKQDEQQQNSFNVSGSSGNSFTNQNSSTAPKPVSKSGSWTNLNAYLDSNKDNAAQMSDKVTGNIDSKASEAETGIKQLPNIDKISTVDYDTLNNNFYNNSQAKKEDYTALKSSGGYNGPTDIYDVQNYNETKKKTEDASASIDQSKTEDGRKTLLKSAYERPNYSLGMQNLDNLLVQNDSGARDKFNNVQAKWSNLNSLLDENTNNLNTNIAFNKEAALKNKNNILAGEEQAKSAILSPINQRVQQMKQDIPLLQSRLQNDVQDNILSDETLAQLGLSEGQSLFDTNLSNYFAPNQTEISANNVSSKEEKAKFKALMDLIDGTDTLNNGSADYNPFSFNKDQFNKDVAAKQAEYEANLQSYRTPSVDIRGPNGTARYTGGQTISELEALKAQNNGQLAPELEAILSNFYNTFQPNRKISRG